MRRWSALSDPRAVLLVNSQSGRAAVQVPARSLMLDDGEVERRVRLIRPMEHPTIPLAMMPQTHWREADRDTFARAWEAEVAEVPEFTDSKIHIVAGLLLPIWKRLPNESTRVYRLQTDAGERIIGRKVSPAWVASALEAGTSNLSPDAAFTALIDGKTILDLAEGLQVRRVRVMGANRIELTGFTEHDAGSAARLRPVRRDHFVEVAFLCPSRCDRSRDPRQGSGVLSDCAHRRSDGGVTCRAMRQSWHIASRARPRRCAVTISPTDVASAITGWSATSGTRRAARCSSA